MSEKKVSREILKESLQRFSYCFTASMRKGQENYIAISETHSAEVVSHDDIHQITGPSRKLHTRERDKPR